MWPADRPDLKRRVAVALARPGRRQAAHRPRPLHLQVGDRRAGVAGDRPGRRRHRRSRRPRHRPDHADRRQWRRPHPDERVQQPSRCAVRQGRPARGPQARLQDLRPHAPAVAALSPAAAHRRAVPHHRARHQRHRDDRPLHHPEHAADLPRVRLRRGVIGTSSTGPISSSSPSPSGSTPGSRSRRRTGGSRSAAR
jgi:hypothetical protein